MSDGIIKSDIHYQEHTGELTHVTSQPTEKIILDRNAELRKNAGAIQDFGSQGNEGSWGRQVASIPFIMFDKAKRAGFQLDSKDAEFAGKEMMRFLATDDGKSCLVVEKL
jgi:hypothetical protein